MVADDAVTAFAQDGVVVVRGLLDAGELERVAAGLERVKADASPAAKMSGDPSQPENGFSLVDVCRWSDIDEISEIALRSGVPRVAADLMDSQTARFHHDHISLSACGELEGHGPLWQQDQPTFTISGRGISAWISVDATPKDGSPEFLAGSHLGPSLLDGDTYARHLDGGAVTEMPDVEQDRSRYDIRRWSLTPGDVLFYDMNIVHSAPGFPFAGQRRVLSLRYLSADARYTPRQWPTYPEFQGLAQELVEGAEFEEADFPLAWPR